MIICLTAPTISDRSILVVALVGVTTVLVAMFSDQPAAAAVLMTFDGWIETNNILNKMVVKKMELISE